MTQFGDQDPICVEINDLLDNIADLMSVQSSFNSDGVQREHSSTTPSSYYTGQPKKYSPPLQSGGVGVRNTSCPLPNTDPSHVYNWGKDIHGYGRQKEAPILGTPHNNTVPHHSRDHRHNYINVLDPESPRMSMSEHHVTCGILLLFVNSDYQKLNDSRRPVQVIPPPGFLDQVDSAVKLIRDYLVPKLGNYRLEIHRNYTTDEILSVSGSWTSHQLRHDTGIPTKDNNHRRYQDMRSPINPLYDCVWIIYLGLGHHHMVESSHAAAAADVGQSYTRHHLHSSNANTIPSQRRSTIIGVDGSECEIMDFPKSSLPVFSIILTQPPSSCTQSRSTKMSMVSLPNSVHVANKYTKCRSNIDDIYINAYNNKHCNSKLIVLNAIGGHSQLNNQNEISVWISDLTVFDYIIGCLISKPKSRDIVSHMMCVQEWTRRCQDHDINHKIVVLKQSISYLLYLR